MQDKKLVERMAREAKRILMIMFGAAMALIAACAPPQKREAQITASPIPQVTAAPTAYVWEPNESAHALDGYGIINAASYTGYRYVTREIAARLIADITGLGAEAKAGEAHPFVDVTGGAEAPIALLYRLDIVEGLSSNRFGGDELCDRETFLLYLLRALEVAGGAPATLMQDGVAAAAAERGLTADAAAGDEMLSIDQAFDICYNALFVHIGDGTQTLLTHLYARGISNTSGCDIGEAYRIEGVEAAPFWRETFDGKTLFDGNVVNADNRIDWYGSNTQGAENRITREGRLELSGNDQYLVDNQWIALRKGILQGRESFGMSFTLNVQNMANEGNEARAVFRVIPRTADARFTRYYAVNYYMTLPLGPYQSNLARCKWSITNTNAPSGTKPLAEAYFLLEEGVDYAARLLIENTDDGVRLSFYIDGPDHDGAAGPLLTYTDNSEYRILQNAAGPAFGSSGYLTAGWGYASTVHVDDVALYDPLEFAAETAQLAAYVNTPLVLNGDAADASQMRYLVRRGVLRPCGRNLDFEGTVEVGQLLASARYFAGEHLSAGETLAAFTGAMHRTLFGGAAEADLTRDVTRYEAAQVALRLLPGEPATGDYRALYGDALNETYRSAVYFAVQNSYLLLDENNRFRGDEPLTRRELLHFFACAADARLRTLNRALQLPAILSDNAVLQADKPIPISGRGMSGDTVTVTFHKQTKRAKVVDGRWSVELESEPYGGPYRLSVRDSGHKLSFGGIYVGEVIVVAGQSNAEMSVYESANNADTLRRFNNQTRVRLFRPESRMAVTPLADTKTRWQVAGDPYSEYILGSASAIGVFCVQELFALKPALKNVRIGIIQITYGGTSIEMFLPSSVTQTPRSDDEVLVSGFWNGFMAGLTPYAARALVYYQGENSAHLGYRYEPLLNDYIRGVRDAFYDAALPVLLVQLSGYGDNYAQDNDLWPEIREVQMRVANTTENVGLVTAIDLSDRNPQEIHPVRKRPVGKRLACLAMKLAYSEDIGGLSARLTNAVLNGKTYSLSFSAAALTLRDDAYGDVAFEVLDSQGRWVAAQARVERDTLLVWSEHVDLPRGVRYAWANYPKACLFDGAGLPVLPFNTTKDLDTPVDAKLFTTNERQLKKAYHLLETGDLVVNLSRNNAARRVRFVDAYVVEYSDGGIAGQSSGDRVALLEKRGECAGGGGTTSEVVSLMGHGLKAGDWLLNTKREALTEVIEVLDGDTLRVRPVMGQGEGDIFELYECRRIITAE